MCGIHFILDKYSKLDQKPIKAMVVSTEYRGPDDSSTDVFSINGAQYFLGASKLNITDSSPGSNQPFIKNGQPEVLLFNGEIYNYQNYKNEQLERSTSFRSNSDTEVLFNYLSTEGIEGLAKLNGMFAIIFLDTRSGHFFIARDRWGMKPLFMYEDNDYLIFSSEIAGILASGIVPKKLNKIAVNQYLNYRYARRPHTFFAGVNEVAPNTSIFYKSSGKEAESRSIYALPPSSISEETGTSNILPNIDKLLTEAVLNHLATKGPTGLFLSGGVDSTLLLAKMHELGIHQVPVFTIVHSKEDQKYATGDQKYSKMAAKQYQAVQYEVPASRKLLECFDDYVSRVEQPVGDSGALLTFLLSKEAAKHLRVILSGAGADELFAGYNRHRAFNFYLKHHGFLKHFSAFGNISGTAVSLINKQKGRLVRKFIRSIQETPAKTWQKMISMEDLGLPENLNWNASDDPLRNAITDDREHYLSQDVLAVSDRMSMQNSIEMRMPFLDRNLSSYVSTVSPSFLLRNGPKHILKKLLSEKGGKVFTHRPKEGLGLPFGGWIDKDKEGLWEFLNEKDHIVFNFVDPQVIVNKLKEHRRGIADHTLSLWSILILARWLDINFG